MIADDMKLFFNATQIPISCFENDTLLLKYSHNLPDYNLPMLLFASLSGPLPNLWYSFTPEYMYFAGMRIKDSNRMLILGPILLMECSLKHAEEICTRLQRKHRERVSFQQYFNHTHAHTLPSLLSALQLMCRLLGQEFPEEIPCLPFRWNIPYPSSPYPQAKELPKEEQQQLEMSIMSCVQSGNTREISRLLHEQILFRTFASPPSLTDQRSYILGANMLLSRAAIRGGVDYLVASELSGEYITRILQCNAADELSYIFISMVQEYTQKVADLQMLPDISPIIKKVHQYVQLRCREKITTRTLAEHLHMNCAYLSTLFKKETGTTLTAYIQYEKIQEAKRLLKGSTLSIVEISEALSFSSQSYFCAVFKKMTGVTPDGYRNAAE